MKSVRSLVIAIIILSGIIATYNDVLAEDPTLRCVQQLTPQVNTRSDGIVTKIVYPLKNSCAVCALTTWQFYQDGDEMFPLGANHTYIPPQSVINVEIIPTKTFGSYSFSIKAVDPCP